MDWNTLTLADVLPVLALAPWVVNVLWVAWFLWQH